MRRWLIIGFVVLLAGCGNETAPNMAGSITNDLTHASPTSTLSPSDPASDSVQAAQEVTITKNVAWMLTDTELPTGYTFNRTTPLRGDYGVQNDLLPEMALTVPFTAPADMIGFVTIVQYADQVLRSEAYTRLVQPMGTAAHALTGLGEEATHALVPNGKQPQTRIVFVRCAVVVLIQKFGSTPDDSAPLVAWAQKIDQRIRDSAFCT